MLDMRSLLTIVGPMAQVGFASRSVSPLERKARQWHTDWAPGLAGKSVVPNIVHICSWYGTFDTHFEQEVN